MSLQQALVGWLKCCFTSTETVGLLGTGAQDVHLDFHMDWLLALISMDWLKCCVTSTETVGLLGTGAQDVHLDFHMDWLLALISMDWLKCCVTSTETVGLFGTGAQDVVYQALDKPLCTSPTLFLSTSKNTDAANKQTRKHKS